MNAMSSLILIARYGQSDYVKNIPLGRVTEDVLSHVQRPLFILNPYVSLSVSIRELGAEDFHLAEQVWTGYHQQRGDPRTDRIFGVFVEGTLAAVARCRKHPDGFEVDGVFVPEDYRGRGYARRRYAGTDRELREGNALYACYSRTCQFLCDIRV